MENMTEHARLELAELTRIAESPRREPTVRAEALLIVHQRRDAGSCLCGWNELGRSHAMHVVGKLKELGLLAKTSNTSGDTP